jgi:hypothetical protein
LTKNFEVKPLLIGIILLGQMSLWGGLIYLSQWHKGPIVQNGGTYYYEIQVVFYGIIGLVAWGLGD